MWRHQYHPDLSFNLIGVYCQFCCQNLVNIDFPEIEVQCFTKILDILATMMSWLSFKLIWIKLGPFAIWISGKTSPPAIFENPPYCFYQNPWQQVFANHFKASIFRWSEKQKCHNSFISISSVNCVAGMCKEERINNHLIFSILAFKWWRVIFLHSEIPGRLLLQ